VIRLQYALTSAKGHGFILPPTQPTTKPALSRRGATESWAGGGEIDFQCLRSAKLRGATMAGCHNRRASTVIGRCQAGGITSWETPGPSQWTGRHDADQKRPATRDRRLDKARICATRPNPRRPARRAKSGARLKPRDCGMGILPMNVHPDGMALWAMGLTGGTPVPRATTAPLWVAHRSRFARCVRSHLAAPSLRPKTNRLPWGEGGRLSADG
jgi:hypothetical protein